MVKLVSEMTLGTFSSNNEVNSRDHVNAIQVRFDEEVIKEDSVLVVPGKRCNEEILEVLAPPKTKKWN